MVTMCAAQSGADDNADSSQNSDFCLYYHDVGFDIRVLIAGG